MHAIDAPLRTATPRCPAFSPRRRLAPCWPAGAGPQDNQLLAALPGADLERWANQLEAVEMAPGQVLYESGCRIGHAYFPTTSLVSLLTLTVEGDCAEVATVGHDGVVGVPLLTGAGSTPGQAVVQCGGQGYRMRGQRLIDEFHRGGAVARLLLRYLQALMTQVAQAATCNRHHSIEQRCCRLILLSLDRVRGSALHTTQEMLACRLGVRRESITNVAIGLQHAGLIRYGRGRIEVLDRAGLEGRACECYRIVRLECERLLPPRPGTPALPEHPLNRKQPS